MLRVRVMYYDMYLPSNHQNRPGCTYCTYAIHRFAFYVPYIEQLDIIYSLSAIFHYMFSGPLHLSRTSSVLLGLKRVRNGVPCNEKKPSLQRGKFLSYSQRVPKHISCRLFSTCCSLFAYHCIWLLNWKCICLVVLPDCVTSEAVVCSYPSILF